MSNPIATDPITPKAHGALDYGMVGVMLAAPSLLKLTGPAKTLLYAFGATQGLLNALTDQPLAVKRLVPFRTHGYVEFASAPVFVALPVLTGAIKEPKFRTLFLALGATLLAVYSMSDWDANDTNR